MNPRFNTKCPKCESFKDNRSKHCRKCSYKIYAPKGGKRKVRGWYKHPQLGYIVGSVKGINYLYHRFLMEKKLKRKLNWWEHVHHKDGNRLNNKLSNLQLITTWEHAKEHSIKRLRDSKGRYQ